MSDIKITRSHAMPLEKARKEAESFADQLNEKFDLEYTWSGDRIEFHRQGVKGFLAVARTEVHIEVTLGLLLSFLKPTIEGHIQDNLDKVFGDASSAKSTAKPFAKTKTATKSSSKKKA
jgi:putative polyhydroxyalkanoate system protein